MNMLDVQAKMQVLNDRIAYYNRLYYEEQISEISDFEYDLLFHSLKNLEEKHPDIVIPNLVTRQVGYRPRKTFSSFTHPVLMGSLGNAFSIDETIDFFTKKSQDLNYSLEQLGKFSCSLKFDGLAIELIYRKGKFTIAATRGDGAVGENITANIRKIESVPKELNLGVEGEKLPELLVIRGELIMFKSEFEKINLELEETGKPLVANPRNLVSGMVRQLDSEMVSPNLKFYAYQLANWEECSAVKPELVSQEAIINTLTQWGFDCNKYTSSVDDVDGIRHYLLKMEKMRNQLDYEIDGVVVKLDDGKVQKILGEVGKRPRYAIAWKLPPEIKKTRLLEVEFNVGRTGKMTPVGILEPVNLAGAMIRRVTLHNVREIESKDIRIGDWVEVIRSGEVIPKVLRSLPELRDGSEKTISFPSLCPSCQSTLVQEEILTYCPNDFCPTIQYQNIVHFVSKEAMNIDGVGKEVVKELLNKKKIRTIVDLYRLKGEDLDDFERMGERLKENILNALEKSKRVPLDRLIFALGINGVGTKMSKIIARRFKSIDNLLEIDKDILYQELLKINEIGEKTALEIKNYFSSEVNQNIIKNLLSCGFRVVNTVQTAIVNSPISNKKILFTGKMNISRNLAKERAESLGAELTSFVSTGLDYLVVGESPGSKLKKAQELGVSVMSEDEFMALIPN